MKRKLAILVAIPAALVLAQLAPSYSTGVYVGLMGIPTNLNHGLPSCGACHRAFPGGLSLKVMVAASAYSLVPNQSIAVTTWSTGGQTSTTWGGFSADVSAGTFSPGNNSYTSPAADFVTHIAASQSNGRSWTYGYTAPSATGLVELYSTVNTVNGNGFADGNDFWGFHGFNSSDIVPTPVRFYVNAPGVTPLGASCGDGYGNVPVLGAKTSPMVGNAAFAVDLVGASPSAPVTLLVGANAAFVPIDLTPLGIGGCTLYVDRLLALAAMTGPGNAQHADGVAMLPLPIPPDAGLRGLQLQVQAVFTDTSAGRAIPVTLSNALRITVQ